MYINMENSDTIVIKNESKNTNLGKFDKKKYIFKPW